MKSLCTKGILFFCLALLVVGAAACTQSRPAVPTPTLVPLENPNLLPTAEGLPTAIIIESQPTAAGGEPTLVPPPLGAETPGAPTDNQPTPIVAEPTLVPTPTTVGETGQVVPTSAPAESTNPPQPASGTCSNPYTVLPGEWFYSIARKCGVTPQALLAANPRLNPSILRPGQKINMPGGGASDGTGSAGGGAPEPTTESEQQAPSGGCSNPYVVQRGDTLYSIARKCGTTAAAIQRANGIPAPDYIFPGQQLRIP